MTKSEIRAQVYCKDGGIFRKSYIQHMNKKDFDNLNKGEYTKAVKLTNRNWYGDNLPETMR